MASTSSFLPFICPSFPLSLLPSFILDGFPVSFLLKQLPETAVSLEPLQLKEVYRGLFSQTTRITFIKPIALKNLLFCHSKGTEHPVHKIAT